MKAFIISTILLCLLLGSWLIFSDFADKSLHELMDIGDKEIAQAVKSENWTEARARMDSMDDKWHKSKKIYALYFRSSNINITDYSIARTNEFIDSEDKVNASAELACIMEQLKFLHGNETLSLENLF